MVRREEQVAAAVPVEIEFLGIGDSCGGMIAGQSQDILAEQPDAFGVGLIIAWPHDLVRRLQDCGGRLAVERHRMTPRWAQQRDSAQCLATIRAPCAGCRVALDDIEASRRRRDVASRSDFGN